MLTSVSRSSLRCPLVNGVKISLKPSSLSRLSSVSTLSLCSANSSCPASLDLSHPSASFSRRSFSSSPNSGKKPESNKNDAKEAAENEKEIDLEEDEEQTEGVLLSPEELQILETWANPSDDPNQNWESVSLPGEDPTMLDIFMSQKELVGGRLKDSAAFSQTIEDKLHEVEFLKRVNENQHVSGSVPTDGPVLSSPQNFASRAEYGAKSIYHDAAMGFEEVMKGIGQIMARKEGESDEVYGKRTTEELERLHDYASRGRKEGYLRELLHFSTKKDIKNFQYFMSGGVNKIDPETGDYLIRPNLFIRWTWPQSWIDEDRALAVQPNPSVPLQKVPHQPEPERFHELSAEYKKTENAKTVSEYVLSRRAFRKKMQEVRRIYGDEYDTAKANFLAARREQWLTEQGQKVLNQRIKAAKAARREEQRALDQRNFEAERQARRVIWRRNRLVANYKIQAKRLKQVEYMLKERETWITSEEQITDDLFLLEKPTPPELVGFWPSLPVSATSNLDNPLHKLWDRERLIKDLGTDDMRILSTKFVLDNDRNIKWNANDEQEDESYWINTKQDALSFAVATAQEADLTLKSLQGVTNRLVDPAPEIVRDAVVSRMNAIREQKQRAKEYKKVRESFAQKKMGSR